MFLDVALGIVDVLLQYICRSKRVRNDIWIENIYFQLGDTTPGLISHTCVIL